MFRLLWITVFTAIVSVSPTALSQSADVPDLRGLWAFTGVEAVGVGGQTFAEGTIEMEIRFEEQDGSFLLGQLTYVGDGHDGEKKIASRKIDILGVISWNDREIRAVAVGEKDGQILEGTIVDENTIAWVQYETGPYGWVAKGVTTRM